MDFKERITPPNDTKQRSRAFLFFDGLFSIRLLPPFLGRQGWKAKGSKTGKIHASRGSIAKILAMGMVRRRGH